MASAQDAQWVRARRFGRGRSVGLVKYRNMRMRFTEHAPEHGEALAQFNERLKAGGERVQFPVSPVPVWLPPGPGRSIYREHFLALDEDGTVRGAYILKHQDFKIGEKTASVGNLQLPISEGAVNRDYANLAGRFLLDARGRTPLLYCLGMGGRDAALARLFAAAGWTMFAVPFFFRVNHPFPFLRKLTLLRSSLARRLAHRSAGVLGARLARSESDPAGAPATRRSDS